MPRILLLMAALASTLAAQTAHYRVDLSGPGAASALLALDLDVHLLAGGADVYVTDPADLAALAQAGFTPTLVHPDVESFYRSRLIQPLTDSPATPIFGQGSMGGYFTYAECIQFMDALAAQYPQIMAPKASLGVTLENRALWMWKISDNPLLDEGEPEVLIDGMHHAREPGTMMSIAWLAQTLCQGYGSDPSLSEIVDRREIFLVPIVNPDGFVYNEATNPLGGGMWRKNRRLNPDSSYGVDPNRNYAYQWGYDNVGSSPTYSSVTYRGPAPFSEPCTNTMKLFAESRSLQLAHTMHTYGNLFFIPPGYDYNVYPPQPLRDRYEAIGAEVEALSGYDADYGWANLYVANGVTEDWWYGSLYGGLQVWSFGSESGSNADGFWPPTNRIQPIAEVATAVNLHLLRIAGSDPRADNLTVTEVGGASAGVWEAGETLEVALDVHNGGTQDGPVTLTVQSASPWVIAPPPLSLGTIAAFGTVTVPGNLLQVQIAAGAPAAVLVSFDLVLSAPNAITSRTTIERFLDLADATPIFDDFETASGWTVGSSVDNATAGIWTRADPNPSTNGGVLFNPDDDHTASGVACWFTGQAPIGASAGSQDVDGITTLNSPDFDLSFIQNPRISYWRWFASSGTDTLEVFLSNDGGTSWILIDTVTGLQNFWTPVSFAFEDHLPRTSRCRIRFRASDDPNNSLCEAAIDDFLIEGLDPALQITPSGTAAPGTLLNLQLAAPLWPLQSYAMAAAVSAQSGIATPLGIIPLDPDLLFLSVYQLPQIFVSFSGQLDAVGAALATVAIPAAPSISGYEFLTAGVILVGSELRAISGGTWTTIP